LTRWERVNTPLFFDFPNVLRVLPFGEQLSKLLRHGAAGALKMEQQRRRAVA
jgi:hypothetical protein